MSGNKTMNLPGVYGEKGKASINNYPGARYGGIGWVDTSTHTLWLFGGYGYGISTTTIGKLFIYLFIYLFYFAHQ